MASRNREIYQLPANNFKGPPTYPHLYPGQRPTGSYALSHDVDGLPTVFYLYDMNLKNLGNSHISANGRDVKLNDFRRQQGRKSIEELVPTFAYGSNISPMQLVERKFGVLTDGSILPNIDVVAVKGWTSGYDVVYMSRSAPYGSAAAKIIPSEDTESEGWLLLLDSEQLMRMHDTEGIREGTYQVGIQDFISDRRAIPYYGYFGGTAKVYVERIGRETTPVRFAGQEYRGQDGSLVSGEDFVPIDARNVRYPERAQVEMMKYYNDLVFDKFGFSLFEWSILPNGDRVYKHTKEGVENLEQVNAFFAEYGEDLAIKQEFIDEPYAIESFRRLKDIL